MKKGKMIAAGIAVVLTAGVDLFQALQVYEWAVKGIIAAN